MLYLLDANVLIDANRDYYSFGIVPQFWEWLEFVGNEGKVKVPIEVYEEVSDGKKDDLAVWTSRAEIKAAMLLNEDADPNLVAHVTEQGYAPDLTDDQLETLGRDPFLISYAFSDLGNRSIVTTEVSKPSKQRNNRKIPDVCGGLGVPCCNTFEFVRTLGFSTNWQAK